MKLPQLSLRELFLWVLVVALSLAWLLEKVQQARYQADVAHTNGSWIIAVGTLPPADAEAVRKVQEEAYDHLRYGR
jgi:hypothetical protein